DRHAVKRAIGERAILGAFGGERLGLGERVGLRAQRDEDRGIIVRADARVSARDGGLEARRARAMRLHDRSARLARPSLPPLAGACAILASTMPSSAPYRPPRA